MISISHMRRCSLMVLVAWFTIPFASSVLLAQPFDDDFANGDPFMNDGLGGDWIDQSQGGGPNSPHSESGSEVTIQDGTGAWNIGKLRTEDGFGWGETAIVALHEVEITFDNGDLVDRGAGISWPGHATISIADSDNAETGFGAFNNDNLAAMNIEIGRDDSEWGFAVHRPGTQNDVQVTIDGGVFDAEINPARPLVATIATTPDGDFEISFNIPYNNGDTSPITGNALGDLLADLGSNWDLGIGAQGANANDAIAIYGRASVGVAAGAPFLRAGDADMDLDFDQLDLVQVQVTAKYLSGQPATWGEGDWDAAPGGQVGSPPPGDGVFDQLDIIAALSAGNYLTGPYAALQPTGVAGDTQTSLGYNAVTGELWVDAPAGLELTSINIDSAAGIFAGGAAESLGGSFDNDADNNIFKATFGGTFGSLSFGNVAQPDLSEDFVFGDLSVVGSLAGGRSLGEVDLIYIPEPAPMALAILGAAGLLRFYRRSWLAAA